MNAKILGHVLFAVGLAGLGSLSLLFDDFALAWQPVPLSIPFRATLAYASGALLLVGESACSSNAPRAGRRWG